MATTYAVTGGAGFIGSHIAERLIVDGHHVHVVDNFLSGKRETIDYLKNLDGDFTFHEIDILDTDQLTPVFKGADVVYHHAALVSVPYSVAHPLETHRNCVTGTLSVLIAARDAGVRRVVYASSSAVYGNSDTPIIAEQQGTDPISPYGAAKLMGEHYCRTFWHSYQLETVALRYFNVFGPRQDPTSQYAPVIPKFIARILDNTPPIIFGSGLQSRDFAYIDNIVHGNLLAASAPDVAGEVMNLATGSSVTLLELMDKLNHVLGTAVQPHHDPPRIGDIMHSCADINKAKDLINFEPIIDFNTGLAKTVTWYKANLP